MKYLIDDIENEFNQIPIESFQHFIESCIKFNEVVLSMSHHGNKKIHNHFVNFKFNYYTSNVKPLIEFHVDYYRNSCIIFTFGYD